MADLLLYFVTVAFSLYFWGIVRTAIWLTPLVFFQQLRQPVCSSFFTFWTITAVFAPYREGFFDLRDFSRTKWVFIFLLTGLSPIGIPGPAGLFTGFLAPALSLGLFKIFRFPANQVLYFPKKIKWILLLIWIVSCILKLSEQAMSELTEFI